MLSMEFKDEEMQNGEVKKMLMAAVGGELKETSTTDAIFDRIIETYPHIGNYLILLYHDAYDVPRVGKDGKDQEESEEVYSYILCAICPVTLTASGLEYNQKSNRIAPRERDWVVQKPSDAFIYPAFEERTVECDKIMYYTAKADTPLHEFMENGLDCKAVQTATEIRERFEHLFFIATESNELKEEYLINVNENMNTLLMGSVDQNKKLILNELKDILFTSNIPESYIQKIVKEYTMEFESAPKILWLLNRKALKKSEESAKKKNLVEMLQEAADTIEKSTGEETDLTSKIRNVVGKYR